MKIQLKPYQSSGVAEALKHPGYAFFFVQGSGKTPTAIAVLEQRQTQVKRCLVVAPLSVLDTWKIQLEKAASFEYEVLVKDFAFKTSKMHILLINYESVWREEKEIKRWRPNIIIADESQKIKKRTSQAAKSLHRLGKSAKFRLALSGTPMDNPGVDVWSQMHFVDPALLGSWGDFTSRFCRDVGFGYRKWILRQRMIPRLKQKLRQRSMRVEKDVLELPPLKHTLFTFNLESQAMELYRELEKEAIITLKDQKTISTPLAITKIMRLQQITGGFVKTDEGEIVKVSEAKLKALSKLLLRHHSSKTVIFSRFLKEISSIQAMLDEMKFRHVTVTGEMDVEDRRHSRNEFLENSLVKVFIAQIKTGGVGINELAVASNCIFFSTTYSWIDYDQALARLHRIGQETSVTVYHLIAKDTVDLDIYKVVRNKGKWSDLILRIGDRYEKDSRG